MKNKYNEIYLLSKDFLLNNLPEGITENELNTYLVYHKNFNSLNDIFIRMLVSLQNYQSMPNIIKFEKNFDKFKTILFDFNPVKVAEMYDFETLYREFCNSFKIANPENKKNSWVKFTKGVISGANYLSKFDSHTDFDRYVESFSRDEDSLIELPKLIQKEIYGFGFALSCDFLKELGYTSYPKPDVHLMEIFYKLNLSEYDQFESYKKIIEMAKAVNKTPYEVDKLFWLICSGKYYYHGITNKPLKAELIEYLTLNI